MQTSLDPADAAIRFTLPAAASRGIAQLLEGPPQPGVLLGATSNAAWFELGGAVVALAGPGSTRLPNGVVVGRYSQVLPDASHGCVIGNGRLETEKADFKVVRWWDPSPSLPPVTKEHLAAATGKARLFLDCSDHEPLRSALRHRDVVAIREAMRDLLGRGDGLTPEGDDLVIGVLAGLRLLGPSVREKWAETLLHEIEPVLYVEARFRTTSLSAALLCHAAAGEVADPVAGLLRALVGRADLALAIGRLLAMGASSGYATACGVLMAADALTEEALDDR